MSEKIIGIMGAMPEEISGIIAFLDNAQSKTFGMRAYTIGTINGIKTVVVFSRWGKVAAAATVSALIHHYNITELIFTGVAGAISPDLNIGDIVIASRLIQHDMNARPLMAEFEIPLLGKTYFETEQYQRDRAIKVITSLLHDGSLTTTVGKDKLASFGINQPKLHVGDIASGDKFFANSKDKNALHTALPDIICVEMEGAAVAQVCYEYAIPFTVIRTISDVADDNSHIDFPKFIEQVSSNYSVCIIKQLYEYYMNII